MGHPLAQYLASPAVVAASAVKGYIAGPDSLDPSLLPPTGAPTFSIIANPPAAKASQTEARSWQGLPLP